MQRRTFLAAIAIGLSVALPAAAELPQGEITLVVPYGPGGATDVVARILADALGAETGRSFIVVNKPGAFGIAAMEYVAAAPADGSVLLMHNGATAAFTPVMYADKMSFDALTAFQPVTRIAGFNSLYVASTKSEPAFASMQEVIDWAKQNPGALRVGNAGQYSLPHMDALKLEATQGIKVTHIPATSGATGMISDLGTGDLHVSGLNEAGAANAIDAGPVRPLMTIGSERAASFPEVPTAKELGFDGFGSGINWQAVFVAAAVPDDVVTSLNEAIHKALARDTAQKALAASLAAPFLSKTPEEFATWMEQEVATFRTDVAELGVEAPQ